MTQIREHPLRSVNSATKYPSILTLHAMGEKGRLSPDLTLPLAGARLWATEKIDGTNARIVVFPDRSFLIGSREDLLFARGDLLHNPAQGIVDAVRDFATHIADADEPAAGAVHVFYGEVFGGNVSGGSKNYTAGKTTGFRLFDLATVPFEQINAPAEALAIWRDAGGQAFADAETLARVADRLQVPVVPPLGVVDGDALPSSVQGVLDWLKSTLPETRAALDDGARKRPEGVVLRSADRKLIAKVRFEDYERTLKARGG